MSRSIVKFASAVAAATLAATGASAAVKIQSVGYSPAGFSGTAYYGATSAATSVGRLSITAKDTVTNAVSNLYTFCIDPFHVISSGNLFNDVSYASVNSNATKRIQLAALLTGTKALYDTASVADQRKIMGATGLAVWEIVFQGGTSAYDVNSGTFRVSGFTGINTLANSYLGKVTSGQWTGGSQWALRSLQTVGRVQHQDQLYMGAVPEPATWALLIGGFGGVGISLRRRRAAGLATA